MEDQGEQGTQKAIAAMWANELGGPLMARLRDELYGSQKPLLEEPELFEASKQKFLAAGKTAIEHKLWRQRDLKLLRLTYLEHLTWNINRDHPRYANERDENEPESLRTGGFPTLNKPRITLGELDAEATSWHLEKEKNTLFKLPEGCNSTALPSDSASVAYMKWELRISTSESTTSREPTCREESIPSKTLEERTKSWRLINQEDLEEERLTAEQVRKMIQDKFNVKNQSKRDSIKESLSDAQTSASSFLRNNKTSCPIRLHKDSPYLLQWFAITKLGRRGRPSKGVGIDGHSGSLYGLIKGSPFNSSAEDQQPAQTSDELQQA
jgi:hypothetical protein